MPVPSPVCDSGIDEKYQCPICTALLCRPVSLPCGHVFCDDCIRRSDLVQCPYCRQPFTQAEITHLRDSDLELFEELSNVLVSCGNHSCDWTGRYGEHDDHLEECEYRLESCVHCKRLISHERLSEHVTTCLRAVIPCAICNRSVERYRHQAHELTCQGLENDVESDDKKMKYSSVGTNANCSTSATTEEGDDINSMPMLQPAAAQQEQSPIVFFCYNQKPKGLRFRWKFCIDSEEKHSPFFLKEGLLLQCIYQTVRRTSGGCIQVKALLPGIGRRDKSDVMYQPIILNWFVTLLGLTEPIELHKKEHVEWHSVHESYTNQNQGISIPGDILALNGLFGTIEVKCKVKLN